MLNAVILAGGLGTRLASVVSHLPKTLAPILGVPFLQLLLHQLETSGVVSKVILALGYKAPDVLSFLQNKSSPLNIEVSIESAPLGTGGALLHALPKTESNPILVLNGDSYFDLSLPSFLSFHQKHKADITIASQKIDDTSRYGSLEIDSQFRITRYCEKTATPQPGWMNAGIYLIQKELLTPFPPGTYSIEKDIFPLFLQKKIFAYPHQGTFIDIGTPNSYNHAQEILKPWIKQ